MLSQPVDLWYSTAKPSATLQKLFTFSLSSSGIHTLPNYPLSTEVSNYCEEEAEQEAVDETHTHTHTHTHTQARENEIIHLPLFEAKMPPQVRLSTQQSIVSLSLSLSFSLSPPLSLSF